MTTTLTIDRQQVLISLMRTTGYIGAKQLDSDDGAYRRISLSEGDMRMLDTFWHESRDRLCLALRRLIESEGLEDDTYRLDLNLSESFDTSLTATLQSSIVAFLTQSMAARWLSITDKATAATYASLATTTLTDITRQAYCKRRPQRPSYVTPAAM